MELYDNNLLYAALCASVLLLQAFWFLIPSTGLEVEVSRKKELLAFAVCCACITLAASTLFRLFPGNNRPPAEDSSVFLYIGKRMLEGKLPYRDLFDHKGPILYLIEVSGLRLSPHSTNGVWVLEVLNLLAASYLIRLSCSFDGCRRMRMENLAGRQLYRGICIAMDYCGGSRFF